MSSAADCKANFDPGAKKCPKMVPRENLTVSLVFRQRLLAKRVSGLYRQVLVGRFQDAFSGCAFGPW
jgi:hypothetical protein